jgi:hypothetical protein
VDDVHLAAVADRLLDLRAHLPADLLRAAQARPPVADEQHPRVASERGGPNRPPIVSFAARGTAVSGPSPHGSSVSTLLTGNVGSSSMPSSSAL